jgi:23S rRNA (cytidine2498-2'-O)-methyltransferase
MKTHLAPRGLEDVLENELGSKVLRRSERLFWTDSDVESFWHQNVWLDVQEFKFQSISQAAKHLKSLQRNWHLHSVTAHRRAQLIQEQLPPLKARPLEFPSPVPSAPLGAWTLLDENTLHYSQTCSSPFPDGVVDFVEDKYGPPSRAYLKLWELFTLANIKPAAGERAIDLGSAPGGWTWVLDRLGCEVISVDKAPLTPVLSASPRVHHRSESAFGLKPEPVDWLFSDIICYPGRLLELVHRWESFARRMVCTIKFQGPTDHAIVREFLKVPGSRVRHLYHNKHELTWSKGLEGR